MKDRLLDRSLAYSLGTQIASKVPSLITAMILARTYDTGIMGSFFFATVAAFFVSMLVAFGTNIHLVRTVAADPQQGLARLGEVLALRVSLIVLVLVVGVAAVAMLAPDLLVIMLLTLLHFLLDDLSHGYGAFLIGHERFGLRLMLSLSGPLVLVVSVILAVSMGASLPQVLLCYVLASVVMLTVSAVTVRIGFGVIPWPRDSSMLRTVALACWPLLALDALQIIQFKVDTIMIYALVSAAAVAEYETAYRLLEVTRLAVRPLAVVAFPICVRLAVGGRWREANHLLLRTSALAAGIGVSLAVVVGLAPDTIMAMIWGEAYRQSGDVLAVLFYTAPMLLVGVICASLANALHLERTIMLIMAGATVFNIALNSWAVPAWGVLGAAWTTLATEFLILASLLISWRRALAARAASSAEAVINE